MRRGRVPSLEKPPSAVRRADSATHVAVCVGGGVLGVYHKRRLPNYGVFDEERWFAPGTTDFELYRMAGMPVGVSICEDLWFPEGPIPPQAQGGAQLVVNINASPYSIGREADRQAVARDRVAESGCAIAYVNQVGGQDELVFDGGSFVMDATGDGPRGRAEIRRGVAPRRRPCPLRRRGHVPPGGVGQRSTA